MNMFFGQKFVAPIILGGYTPMAVACFLQNLLRLPG